MPESPLGGEVADLEAAGRSGVVEYLLEDVRKRYEARVEDYGEERMQALERFLLLNAIDGKWKDHLY